MNATDYIIDVTGLNKSFAGKPAVVDLSLKVHKGEIFGFLGPNGSGKTTTIRMLCGLLIPDSGSGQCLGYNILTQSYQIKRHVGYMTQGFSLYGDLTVRENLDFIGRIYQIEDRQKGVAEIIADLGFEQRKNQLAGSLSGGWKQRLALAAALLHRPQLLLLDEPTAGVDPKARRDFWDQIHLLAAKGITSLVSTHYMDEVERCNRIAYISNGYLIVQGTLKEVIAHTKLITWQVTGPDLVELATKLNKLSGVEQVSVFGASLHVSGRDNTKLAQSIAAYQDDPQYKWEQIPPGIEDIFISLVGSSKEERYD